MKSEATHIRWAADELEPVKALADREVDGNVSLMIRKLVREALASRRLTTGNHHDATKGHQ